MSNYKFTIVNLTLLILLLAGGCNDVYVEPSPFIKGFVNYYIGDTLNKNLEHKNYVIKVITKITKEEYYIDVVGYEKRELSEEDDYSYGFSYIGKFKILYYGDVIPQFTKVTKLKRKSTRYKNKLLNEYDPNVFRIVVKKSNLEFISDKSFKVSTLIDNQPLKQIVNDYLRVQK